MVNPIKSVVQDYVTTTITNKVLGGDKKHPQQQQHSHSSSGVGGILGKITSTIGSTLNPNQQSHHQQPPNQQMSGSGYYQGGGGGGYPGGQQPGYQPYGQPQQQGTGYPPPTGGAYPGYPPPQQPYPDYNQNMGYGTTGGGTAPAYGFNIDPSYPPSSQPYGGGGGQAPYPSAQSGGGYPPSSNYNYPPSAPYPSDGGYGGPPPPQQQQQFGAGYGGYPPPSSQSQQQSHFPPGNYSSFSQPAPAPAMATPSIRPNPNFNAQHTAELLRKAMKGFGCDKGKVIQALVNCSNAQRQEVTRVFKQMYGKDLLKELRSELTGDFEDLILALMEHPARYDAAQLRRAMEGLGTKEHVLIEIMTTRSNAQIHQIKMAYQQMYGGDLERDLIGETSGYFKRMLVALCSGARDESWNTDPVRANQDAHKLYRAGEGRLGTDESTFMSVLAAQNYGQLRLVFNEYQKVSGHSIDQAVVNEFSGDIKDGLLAIVKSIRNRPAYFAELLYNSMKGFGTRDTDLIRLVVSRSEIDLADIRTAYQQLYGVSLEQAIASDCSGAYKDGLIACVKGFYH